MDRSEIRISGRIQSKRHAGVFLFRKDFSAWILLLPSLLCIYFVILRPQILQIYWSFFDMKGFTPQEFVGFENYRRVVSDSVFAKTFWNTCQYVLWSIVIGFSIPFIVAVIMNELLHFRRLTRMIVYLPSIMPVVAVSLLWYFIYYPDASGLLNVLLEKFGIEPYNWLQDSRFTILYIVISMTWSGMGGTAIYYFSGLQGINSELYEAAIIDGAGFFRRIKVVTIPQMSGMLILFFIKQIISVFNIMEQPMQMTDGGPNNASLTLGLMNYRYGFVMNKPQLAMAQGVIMFLVLIIFAALYFKVNKKIEEGQM